MRVFSILFFVVFVHCISSCSGSSGHREKKSQQIERLEPSNTSSNIVKIIDGDTYDVLIEGVKTRIRMEGIDAPERGMDFYKKSKEYLSELCNGQQVKVVGDEKDRYGRLIAKTYLEDGREVGEEMVRAGMAWHFKKYSSDKTLNDLEIIARDQRVGLWSMPEPIPPWEHRKHKRKKKTSLLLLPTYYPLGVLEFVFQCPQPSLI
jgi:micrococcal nuclease